MNKLENQNMNGTFLSVKQIAYDMNIGESTARRIAKESGAGVYIGRCYRIDREKFLNSLKSGDRRCKEDE